MVAAMPILQNQDGLGGLFKKLGLKVFRIFLVSTFGPRVFRRFRFRPLGPDPLDRLALLGLPSVSRYGCDGLTGEPGDTL